MISSFVFKVNVLTVRLGWLIFPRRGVRQAMAGGAGRAGRAGGHHSLLFKVTICYTLAEIQNTGVKMNQVTTAASYANEVFKKYASRY